MRVSLMIVALVFGACSAARLDFLNIPDSVELADGGELRTDEISDFTEYLMGVSSSQPKTVSSKINLFQRPAAAVVIVVAKPESAQLDLPAVKTYRLNQEELPDFYGTFNTIENGFVGSNPIVLDVDSEISGTRSSEIQYDPENLNTATKSSPLLTSQLAATTATLNWISTSKNNLRRNAPGFYVFHLNGLALVGAKSPDKDEQTKTAVMQVEKIMEQILQTFKTAYDGNVLVEVVSVSGAKIRKPRQAEVPETIGTKYQFYSTNYPVIFNIILWMTIALAITILFISIAIWNMDPGRDSIIYRMTASRMKKD